MKTLHLERFWKQSKQATRGAVKKQEEVKRKSIEEAKQKQGQNERRPKSKL